jgi:hypothetical protein
VNSPPKDKTVKISVFRHYTQKKSTAMGIPNFSNVPRRQVFLRSVDNLYLECKIVIELLLKRIWVTSEFYYYPKVAINTFVYGRSCMLWKWDLAMIVEWYAGTFALRWEWGSKSKSSAMAEWDCETVVYDRTIIRQNRLKSEGSRGIEKKIRDWGQMNQAGISGRKSVWGHR